MEFSDILSINLVSKETKSKESIRPKAVFRRDKEDNQAQILEDY
jgi:hypothetical protein